MGVIATATWTLDLGPAAQHAAAWRRAMQTALRCVAAWYMAAAHPAVLQVMMMRLSWHGHCEPRAKVLFCTRRSALSCDEVVHHTEGCWSRVLCGPKRMFVCLEADAAGCFSR